MENIICSTIPLSRILPASSGVCVLRQKTAKADLSELAPGLYIVKENGTTRKVVKK